MPSQEVIAQEIRSALSEVIAFICSPQMESVMKEFASLPQHERAKYVTDVLINPEEIRRRGVEVPPDMIIQRSAFKDERPTLFCVTKHLPPDLGWEKVTVTFDNPSGPPAVSYSQLEEYARA
nr:hypothetical protein StreXyl84_77390 [Streptomyces sp. Xyl84]